MDKFSRKRHEKDTRERSEKHLQRIFGSYAQKIHKLTDELKTDLDKVAAQQFPEIGRPNSHNISVATLHMAFAGEFLMRISSQHGLSEIQVKHLSLELGNEALNEAIERSAEFKKNSVKMFEEFFKKSKLKKKLEEQEDRFHRDIGEFNNRENNKRLKDVTDDK